MEPQDKHPILTHIDSRFDELERLVKSGFPDGDLESHRRAHEAYIAEAKASQELWKSVREKTVTGVVWGLLLMVGVSIWEYIKLRING